MGNIISILSGKGGVGKTTIAAGLGIQLAHKDKKILLIDMDFGLNNLDVILGIDCSHEYQLNDVIKHQCRISQAIIPVKTVEGLYLLTSSEFQTNVNFMEIQSTIAALASEYDTIILDGPAGIGEISKCCVETANDVYLVITPEAASIHDMSSFLFWLKENNISVKKKLIVNCISKKDVKASFPAELANLLEVSDYTFILYHKKISRINGIYDKNFFIT